MERENRGRDGWGSVSVYIDCQTSKEGCCMWRGARPRLGAPTLQVNWSSYSQSSMHTTGPTVYSSEWHFLEPEKWKRQICPLWMSVHNFAIMNPNVVKIFQFEPKWWTNKLTLTSLKQCHWCAIKLGSLVCEPLQIFIAIFCHFVFLPWDFSQHTDGDRRHLAWHGSVWRQHDPAIGTIKTRYLACDILFVKLV